MRVSDPKKKSAKGRGKKHSLTARKGRVSGGKVLARLRQFYIQREIGTQKVQTLARSAPPGRSIRTTPSTVRSTVEATSMYISAFEQLNRLKRTTMAPPAAAPAAIPQGWRPLGPFSIPHGQTYGKGAHSRPAVSGRITAIAVDPVNTNHILVAAASGGVWESLDDGDTWSPRTDDQASLAIGALAFDPNNSLIAYAGTGEGDTTFPSQPRNLRGAGLLRSTDGGTSWSLHALGPFEEAGFFDIAVDPLDSDHLLAGTSMGLFDSTDGGATWSRRRAKRTWSVSFHPAVTGDPNSTREVFAGCSDGVIRSTNGGTTWSVVSLPGDPGSWERIEVCHAPSNGNVVYAVAAGPPLVLDPIYGPIWGSTQPTPYLWRRNVSAGSFALFSAPPDLQTGQAWYDWFASVSPNNPDVLYVGGINAHRGERYADGQWNWTNISAKNSGDSIHPDQHAIAFSPVDANVVYIGNDGGVYRSPNGGASWQSLNKGLNITEFEYLAQHPEHEAWLLGGTQDNGTQLFQGQRVWYHVADGDGGDCCISDKHPETCFHTYYGMGVYRSRKGGAWDTWRDKSPTVPSSEDYPNGSLFYPPVAAKGDLVGQASRSVYLSRNLGNKWTRVKLPAIAGIASAMDMQSEKQVYVGTNNGRIYRIDFVSGSWEAPVACTRPRPGFVSDILVDSTNVNRIWVTFTSLSVGGRVFRSDDGGSNWTDVTAGLPEIPVNSIEIDPQNPDTVFVGCDVGVYRSMNAGANWTPYSNQLPNALIKDLLFHEPSRLLRAATQSRGVWEIAVDDATMPDVEVYVRDSKVDTGRQSPSPSGVDDPFEFGAKTFWWQCTDLKVDSPTFLTPSLNGVDFELFEDDQSMVVGSHNFAAGLIHQNIQRNRTVRVYAHLHNRGVEPAIEVAAKIFFCNASVTPPDLPADFWTDFPNNVVSADSPWQPIASHKIVPVIEAGHSSIVGFEWRIPDNTAAQTSMLVIVTAENDLLSTTELSVANLVRNNKKCGLQNVAVVNPPPSVGPHMRAVRLNLWGTAGAQSFSIGVDSPKAPLIRGFILSKRLAKAAQKAGLSKVTITDEDQADLADLLDRKPALKKQLETGCAWRASGSETWLKSIVLNARKPEPVVVLVDAKLDRGRTSILQWNKDGELMSGFTLHAVR